MSWEASGLYVYTLHFSFLWLAFQVEYMQAIYSWDTHCVYI